MTKSTLSSAPNKPAPDKPEKPHADFPLFPHATRRWAKKVRGKMEYFGPWDRPAEALEEWLRVKDDLLAGRARRPKGDGFTLCSLVNEFLSAKKSRVESDELSPRSFQDYYDTCERLINHFGRSRPVSDIRPADLDALRGVWARQWGPTTLGNEIQRARVVLNYAFKQGLVDVPVRFGTGFAKPSAKTLRKHRDANAATHGKRMFSADELRKLVASAPVAMQAMILLAINCGFGQTDCAALPIGAIDFEGKMIDFPRPKTAARRRCPLWPETVDALRAAIESRPAPKHPADAGLVFLTRCGARWVRTAESLMLDDDGAAMVNDAGQPKTKVVPDDAVAKAFSRLLTAAGIRGNGERKGVAFYAIRHTFRTVADALADRPAIDLVMGHTDPSMAGAYREEIPEKRLRAVTDYVRKWYLKKTE